MKTLNQNQLLDEKIKFLKLKQENDLVILKENFFMNLESLKPINLIKGTIEDFKKSKEIKNSLFESALGIAGGIIKRKMLVGKSSGVIKKVSASILQYVVSNFITNQAEKINSNEKHI